MICPRFPEKMKSLYQCFKGYFQELFSFFFRHGARADIPDYRKKRVVHKAAVTNDTRYTKALCEHVSDMAATLDTENEEGATALMLACQREAVEQVEELLKQDVSYMPLDGTTYLIIYVSYSF